MATVRTFCRVCEAHCGLVAEVEGSEVVALRPDDAHPLSRGYSCVKGLALGDMNRDPDRLDHPLRRSDAGWERLDWSTAMESIGATVKRIRAEHGDRAVALYTGNPTYFSFQNVLFSSAFLEALGSPNVFSSHSVDANPKFDVATQMYGISIVQPVPDIRHARFVMCLGTNPVVSQMSVVHLPDPLRRLREVTERGGRVVIVDPRRTETAQKVGEHLPIVPGTDVFLLMGMLHHLAHEGRLQLGRLRQVARDVDAFVHTAAAFTPERCAEHCGIDAATIRELAAAFRDADGGCLYMSTGVNMGPFGSLCAWLLQGLHLVTGQMDRRGGLLVPRGAFDAFTVAKALGLGTENGHRTLARGWHQVAGCFPSAALAEEITIEHPERIRALFVSCGNPLHSIPGDALRRALPELELLVSIDLYRNETGEHADYLLPATDMLERSDFPVSWTVLQETPHAQYTPPVVPPRAERRPEWAIFSDLALACGAKPLGASLLNALPYLNRGLAKLGRAITPDHLLALLLRWGGQTTLGELKKHPGGVLLEPSEPGSFLGRRVPTGDGKVHLAPPRLLDDIARLEAARPARRDGRLHLIGRRERKSHNSWMHNVRFIRQPGSNVALMHPDDAARRGIEADTEIEVASDQGRITIPVRLTTDVAPGVIAVPHGWGHAGSGLERAKTLGGDNINRVIPGGPEHMEPVSGQAIMLAHQVEVRPAP